MRNEDGETIESRNSAAWKNGRGYPNPQGMSQTDSSTRPMYCGSQTTPCSVPYCKTSNDPAPLPTMAPVSVPTPVGDTPSSMCVASLATYYSDAAVWEPYCAQVG